MLRVVGLLGILAIILAVIMAWWIRVDAPVDQPSNSGEPAISKRTGTSTLSHGSSAPHPSAGQPSADPGRR